MARYRLRERFEGIQWMGAETPEKDMDWLRALPDGPSTVKSVEFIGDRLRVTTHLTESELVPTDYIMYGNNRQPLVMPANVFDARYEIDD